MDRRLVETPYEAFLEDPVGRYTVTGTSLVWCASCELCGAALWDKPTQAESRAILRIFDGYPRHMADRFDIVLDVRDVEHVSPAGLADLFAWLLANGAALRPRLRMQANLIRGGHVAFLLTGLLPVAKWPIPFELHKEPAAAFRSVAGESGVAIATEVEAVIAGVRGPARELSLTRQALTQRHDATLAEVSHTIGVSTRSLQRLLRRHGTTFHAEVVAARWARAQQLLDSSDDKVSTIAANLGISERSLTILVRRMTGLSPAAWRDRAKD